MADVQKKNTEAQGAGGYTVLDRVNSPADLKDLSAGELRDLCDELRAFMIDSVSKTGGHLGAGLGVVELTVALHAVFDTPADRVIWDVGHQAYPHKILTGRKGRMDSLRQGGGLSGFTKRSESEYDPFGAGHSSTSISAALGMAVGRDMQGGDNHVIAVIGDGAMSAGMAYEAMNNAGAEKSDMIVILNDNDMSIAPPVGALSRHLSNIVSSSPYRKAREIGKKITDALPTPLRNAARRLEEGTRVNMGGGSLFEDLGFYYIGPVDGHDLDSLLTILRNLKERGDHGRKGPVLIHAVTEKGKGYDAAEHAADRMHAIKPAAKSSDKKVDSPPTPPSYTNVFADSLIECARGDDKVVAITAAMPSGTGLDKFAKTLPQQCFDVGIAEQHGVTFAAGLACEGVKPFVAIYSTFLQRAYDQIIHDVALQNLPVRFAIDRAGLVGADGASHAGSFDIAYLGCLPNMVLMAAADEAELVRMVKTAYVYNDGPIAFRYPRGNGVGVALPSFDEAETLPLGKGRILREGSDIALLSYGTRLEESMKAADILTDQHGLSVSVADARFAKPLDVDLIDNLSKQHKALITIEEGSVCGFGALVMQAFIDLETSDKRAKVANLVLPDIFLDHDSPYNQYSQAGLNAEQIAAKALSLYYQELS